MRKDPLTNELFVPKRRNQVFATAENRIAYHNKKATELRYKLDYLNKPLLANYKVLTALMQKDSERVFHKEFLLGKGFDFKVCNHINSINGKNHFAIFNFTVIKSDGSQIKIIKQ
jgi:hypothetical protein